MKAKAIPYMLLSKCIPPLFSFCIYILRYIPAAKPCRFFLYAFAAGMYLFVQATSPFLCIRLNSAWIFLPEAWTKPVKTLCICGFFNFVLL